MSSESILCISYFDTVLGPNTFYCNEHLDTEEHPDLGRILEFQEREGSFLFAFRKYQTINHIFYIDSDIARGGKELLMITYMIRAAYFKDEVTDVYRYLESKIPELEEFASELKTLDEITKILQSHKNLKIRKNLLSLASDEFRNHFLATYNKYYRRITPQIPITSPSLISKGDLKKFYIFGPRKSGKTTLLKNLEVIQFLQYKDKEKKREIINKIYDFIIDNIEILTYECIDEDVDGERAKLYDDCMENAQGFILIFNANIKESIKDTIEMFQLILNKCMDQGESMPVLIIGNKFYDKEVIDPKFIYDNFDLDELAECGIPVKYLPMSVLADDEIIMEALRWLLKQII